MKIKKLIKDNKNSFLFIIFLISFCLFLGLLSVKESDYFWHLKAGEYMVKNKLILVKDVFSWSLEGHKWFSHEWLFEVIIYRLKSFFPNSHVFIYTFICSFLLFFVLFWHNRKNWLKNMSFTSFWIIISLLFVGLLKARPHMFSNVLLAICLVIYKDLFYNEKSKLIYFLPLVSLVWVNVHGGSSSLLYIIGFIFVICGMFKFKFNKIETEQKRLTKKQLIKYLGCIGVSILVLMINPSGFSMIAYPYINMGDSFMIKLISEWQQTDLNNWFHLLYVAFLVMILLIFIFSKKKIKLLDFVLFGIGAFLGLKSIRFWMYVYIFSSIFIFDYISDKRIMEKNNRLILISLSFIFMFIFITNTDMIVKRNNQIGNKMINKIKAENPSKLYNFYDYGGYLIYNDIKVFVDGRADLYSNGVLVEYVDLYRLNSGYEKVINKYDFDYYLVPKSSKISDYLKNNDSYELLLKDDEAILYRKK